MYQICLMVLYYKIIDYYLLYLSIKNKRKTRIFYSIYLLFIFIYIIYIIYMITASNKAGGEHCFSKIVFNTFLEGIF